MFMVHKKHVDFVNNDHSKFLTSKDSSELLVKVEFDSNGGSSVSAQKYAIEQPYGSLPSTTKQGFSFSGWYKDIGLQTKVLTSDNANFLDRKLYAGWREGQNYQYFKLHVDAIKSGSVFQISRIEFINSDGDYFEYPDSTTWTATGISTWPTSQTAIKALDHDVTTKMCPTLSTLPCEIIYDMKSQCLDLETYTRWQWYTGNDTEYYSSRNLKTFSMYVSVDGTEWIQVDSATDYSAPASNYTLAYTGNITI